MGGKHQYCPNPECLITFNRNVLTYILHIQVALAGVLRGCGKQVLVAISNIGSFYLVGLPVSLTLVYIADMGALGFWVGCTLGSVTQVKSVSTILPNWIRSTAVNNVGYFDTTHRLQCGITQGTVMYAVKLFCTVYCKYTFHCN